jgi:protocatechuate 4,5-dioxygenase beta chain
MARITAGIASSHVPLLGVAVDQGKTQDDYFGPIFAGYEWTRAWERERSPM